MLDIGKCILMKLFFVCLQDSTEKNTKESEDVSHEDEDNNNVAKEDASPPFLLDWLPPEPLLCPEFDALIT